jgi:CRISPR-associated protein Csb2
MLAFGIRYLNGYVTATEPDSHERVEWPPHPGRVFMALAAAHFETGADAAEREALMWLQESAQAPVLRAPAPAVRTVVEQFVPVNDKSIWKKEKPGQKPSPPLQSAPGIMRDRQGRTFARAFLQDDTVYLSWPAAQPRQPVRRALDGLCAKVTRVGHSSSLVQMWVASEDEIEQPNWLPDEDRAVIHLRMPTSGTLEDLERRYQQQRIETFAELQVVAEDDSNKAAQKAAKQRLKEEFPDGAPARLRPQLSAYQGYAPASARESTAAPGTVFSPHPLVLTLERETGEYRHLDLLSVLAVAQRWREAILTQSNGLPDRVRELLSGHGPDGAPLDGPHLTFLPLAFVGHEHADGRLLGMALSLPADVSPDDRRAALRAIGAVRRLALGRLGTWNVVPVAAASPTWNLRPELWTAHPEGATHWSTVTPVVFDRHPKTETRAAYQREVAAMIATACQRIGLPAPREVIATQVSAHVGVPPAFAFPRLRRKDNSERRHAHAILVFEEPVRGPIVIGAGRFRGYGFCRAMHVEAGLEEVGASVGTNEPLGQASTRGSRDD